jgi:succinyl-CoA synthetase beta subunit
MIAGGAQIEKEFYFSVLLDRANRSYLSLCSVEGGMEIEQLAVEKPEALAKVEVDPLTGIDAAKALEIAKAGGFDDELAAVADVFVKLYNVYTGEGATLVEVNPSSRMPRATSSPSTARCRSTTTPPRCATPSTRSSRTRTPPTRSRRRPRHPA